MSSRGGGQGGRGARREGCALRGLEGGRGRGGGNAIKGMDREDRRGQERRSNPKRWVLNHTPKPQILTPEPTRYCKNVEQYFKKSKDASVATRGSGPTVTPSRAGGGGAPATVTRREADVTPRPIRHPLYQNISMAVGAAAQC